MAKPNKTQQAILGFLTWGPMSGYDIKRNIEASIANFWSESYGQIYPMLRQLEAEGLASCRRDRTGGGRPRNVYSITEAGRVQLREWLAQPTAPPPSRNEELLKLFFGRLADPADNVRRIEDYRAQHEEDLDRYAAIRERLEGAAELPGAAPDVDYWLMTLRYGELDAEARLRWCEETLARLRELATPAKDDPPVAP